MSDIVAPQVPMKMIVEVEVGLNDRELYEEGKDNVAKILYNPLASAGVMIIMKDKQSIFYSSAYRYLVREVPKSILV